MLIKEIIKNCKTVSIVGMAKNVGKTVTLNELVIQAREVGITLGITSIGRDGESRDLVTDTEKPRIYVYPGTIIATAEKLLNRSDLKYEILEVLSERTILGKIVLIRVTREGFVDVSGPFSNRTIKDACDRMLRWGADLAIVDGALDRKTSASPSITDGTILSTGAALSRDLNKVIKDTSYKIRLLSLDVFSDERYKSIVKDAFELEELCVIEENLNRVTIDVATAINSGKNISKNMTDDTRVIVLPGSLTGSLVNDMAAHRSLRGIKIIVRDSTKIFITEDQWQLLMSRGAKIEVYEKINLVAVTVNPISPKGYYFQADQLIEGISKYHKDVKIIDVLMEDGYGFIKY